MNIFNKEFKKEFRRILAHCDCQFKVSNMIYDYFYGVYKFSGKEFYDALSEDDKKEFKETYIYHNTQCVRKYNIEQVEHDFKELYEEGIE